MLVNYVHVPFSEKQKEKHDKKVLEFVMWMERECPDGFTEEYCMRITHYSRFVVKRYLQDAISLKLCVCNKKGRTITWQSNLQHD